MTLRMCFYASFAVLALCVGFSIYGHFRTTRAVVADVVAQAATSVADVSQGQAVAKDDMVAKLTAAHAKDQKTVAAAKAEVKRLQAVIDSQPPPAPASITPEHAALIELDAAKDVEIARQDDQIKGLEAINGALIEDRNQWQQTAELRLRQARAQQAATDSWKKAAETWKQEGRIEGGGAVAILIGIVKLVAR